ALSSGLPSAK
ncbi:rCG30620, partial [Rattus norvegicus]